jgi:hypothetical protein
LEIEKNGTLGHPMSSVFEFPAKMELKVTCPHGTFLNRGKINMIIGFFEMLLDACP